MKGTENCCTGGNVMADPSESLNAEQIFWFLTTAYIGKVAGLLNPTMEGRLDHLFHHQSKTSWIEQVEEGLGIDADFIRSVYELCTKRNSSEAAIGFILRGLGCPAAEVDARIRELRGLHAPQPPTNGERGR